MFDVGDKVHIKDEEYKDLVGVIKENCNNGIYMVEVDDEHIAFCPVENLEHIQ